MTLARTARCSTPSRSRSTGWVRPRHLPPRPVRAANYACKSTESDDLQVMSLSAQVAWAREACTHLGIADPLLFEEKQLTA
ncbi:MAG: hypothetical protein IT186_05275 [Acidobacteria bacterium]|nr:hypothetical protein [Acidobacteriota bacterium]